MIYSKNMTSCYCLGGFSRAWHDLECSGNFAKSILVMGILIVGSQSLVLV